MSITIIDLDNCISDDDWRRCHIDYDAESDFLRWHDYHSLSAFDTLHNRHILQRAKRQTNVIVTTRTTPYRAITEEWLRRNQVAFSGLMMRNIDDVRPPSEVKAEQVQAMMQAYKASNGGAAVPIDRAHDDDPNVIEAYKALGIRTERTYIRADRDYNHRPFAPDK